ncbi:MAG: hypothetical protein AAF988_06995 [Pseudomonadota bacterium]
MANNETILSQEPRQAIQDMLTITEEMTARIELETAALAQNDGTSFTMNEPEKEHVAEVYDKAAAEFHARLEELNNVDNALMEKLKAANESLKQSTANNIRLLEKIDPENKNSGNA